MELEISEASAPDDSIVQLWEACGLTRPWNDPVADIRLALQSPGSALIVAHAGDALVATIMVGFDGHRGWVYYLAVTPDIRGRGIGRVMMAAAETWLRERGAPSLRLMVRDDNDAALGFYERLGFETQAVVTLGKRI